MAEYRVTAPCYRFMSEIEDDQFAEAAPTSRAPGVVGISGKRTYGFELHADA